MNSTVIKLKCCYEIIQNIAQASERFFLLLNHGQMLKTSVRTNTSRLQTWQKGQTSAVTPKDLPVDTDMEKSQCLSTLTFEETTHWCSKTDRNTAQTSEIYGFVLERVEHHGQSGQLDRAEC